MAKSSEKKKGEKIILLSHLMLINQHDLAQKQSPKYFTFNKIVIFFYRLPFSTLVRA